MKIAEQNGVVSVSEVEYLDAANAGAFRSAIISAVSAGVAQVNVDLSATRSFDCSGLGALVALANHSRSGKLPGNVVLLHPNLKVKRMLDLAQLNKAFAVGDAEQPPVIALPPEVIPLVPDCRRDAA